MKYITRRLGIGLLLLVLSAQAFGSPQSYSGGLTGANGGLVGTGSWVDKMLSKPNQRAMWSAPTFNWTVSQNANSTWHYEYTLQVSQKDISHAVIEVSRTFGGRDIWGVHGGCVEIGDYGPGDHENQGIPAQIHGIKFDISSGTTSHLYFDSDRAPVWGDFYSRGGKDSGSKDWNAVWNAGFLKPYAYVDIPISDATYQDHILVPDSAIRSVVPEPASFASLLAGFLGLFGLLRRRRG